MTIGDGGFVDWTRKATGYENERRLIGGIGLDRLAHFGEWRGCGPRAQGGSSLIFLAGTGPFDRG